MAGIAHLLGRRRGCAANHQADGEECDPVLENSFGYREFHDLDQTLCFSLYRMNGLILHEKTSIAAEAMSR